MISYLKKTGKIIFLMTAGILLTRTFVVEAGRVDGISMEPTYFDTQVFFVNKFSLLFSEPYRGEIVQCRDPKKGSLVIKRIIGLPGEQVSIKQNHVFITDPQGITYQLYEPYLGTDVSTESFGNTITDYPVLGPNQYFILGDNRPHSLDSRHYGILERQNILGSVMTQF